MRGSESRGISFPLVDYLEIRFIKVNRLFRSSVIKKLFSESQMRLFHFLKKYANAGERFRLTLERIGKEEFKKRGSGPLTKADRCTDKQNVDKNRKGEKEHGRNTI